MKKDKKIALIIMFVVFFILIMVAIEYDNKTTAEKIRNEREKIEERLEIAKLKDSIENKKD